MKKILYLIGVVVVGVGFASAECDFLPERTFGKVEVLDVSRFNQPKRNKCFRERGQQLGKILFRYEPEGTYETYEYIGYFDAVTQCFDTDERLISCWDVPVGSEIGSVGFIERNRHPRSRRNGRGSITQLILVP